MCHRHFGEIDAWNSLRVSCHFAAELTRPIYPERTLLDCYTDNITWQPDIADGSRKFFLCVCGEGGAQMHLTTPSVPRSDPICNLESYFRSVKKLLLHDFWVEAGSYPKCLEPGKNLHYIGFPSRPLEGGRECWFPPLLSRDIRLTVRSIEIDTLKLDCLSGSMGWNMSMRPSDW